MECNEPPGIQVTERELFCSLPFRVNVPYKTLWDFWDKEPSGQCKAWALAPGVLNQEGKEQLPTKPCAGRSGRPLAAATSYTSGQAARPGLLAPGKGEERAAPQPEE